MAGRTNGPLFLSIDAGTTSMKAAVFDLRGQMLGFDRQEYTLDTPAPAQVELDADHYWSACCSAVRNALRWSCTDPRQVASVCVSTQGETLIAVDSSGRPLRRAIVWLDNRAVDEAERIAGRFPIDEVYRVSGQGVVSPTWPACKLMWLRAHEPEVFDRSAKFLLLEDYLVFRLTGVYASSFSVQSSSLLLDIRSRHWWPEMLEFAGVRSDQLPRLAESGQPIGPLTGRAAEALGLTTRTVVVSGGMDQTLGAVGAANIEQGIISETTGGALALVASLDRPRLDPLRRVPCHCHAVEGGYCLLPWGQTAGMALVWFRDNFCRPEVEEARDEGVEVYDLLTGLAQDVPAGSEGLVVLPHLEGAACPEHNPAAKAVFFGATLRHTRGHFIRAILESVAYMLRRNVEIVEELALPVAEVRSLGGGSRSRLWLQIKADVLQKPIRPVRVEEAACLGAAILGSVATGHYANLADAVAQMVVLGESVEPTRAHASLYDKAFAQYVQLYGRLEEMF